MADAIYRFSRCEVDPNARELRVDGQGRLIEPRPFDVLVLLLRHRDRTVSTEELLDRLWRDESVAPGSVVNAMAKVRRAVGDDGKPALIRTIHRVGYRFVGDVVEAVPVAAGQPGMPSGPPPLPFALLPFENLTGTPSLDWVALGLMSLVGQALSQDGRLAPLPVSVVVGALRRVPDGADAHERARAVQQFTGARHIAHTRLRRQGDAYLLDCRLSAPNGEAEGVLQASHPAALGRVLARWLLAQLAPDGPTAPKDEPATDPWAQEVLARALESSAARQWKRAEALLAVVLDLEPDHPMARVELLRARAMLREAEGRFGAALDLWREAVAGARAAHLHAVAARANSRAALAAAMCGLRDEAVARAEDGLAQAQARGVSEDLWRQAALMWQVHAMVGQPLRSRPTGHAADAGELSDGALAASWAARAHALAQEGDHGGAAAAFAHAAQLYGEVGASGREGTVQMWWVDSLLQAGRVAEAEVLLERAEACSGGHGMLLRWLPWLRARLRYARGDRAGALVALAPVLEGPAIDLAHAVAASLAAQWLAEDGRTAEARATAAHIGSSFAAHPLVARGGVRYIS